MSVLLQDEDAAALEEALAFIDEFSLPPAEGYYALWAELDNTTPTDASHSPKPNKRVRDPKADARRRLKRKGEREALRLLVKQLERQLAKARRTFQPRSESSDATDGDESDKTDKSVAVTKRTALRWYRALMEEQRRRRVSEELNAQLRSAVSMQSNVVAALQQCVTQLAKADALDVRDAVNPPTPTLQLRFELMPQVLGELMRAVHRQYEEANASWDSSLVGSVTRGFEVRTDPVVGAYCETYAAAPLGQAVADVSQLLCIGFLWTKLPTDSPNSILGKVATLKKESNMELQVDGKLLRLHGVVVLLWSQQADRTVLAYSSLLFHSSGKFCFREGGWVVVQQSPTNPTGESSFQSRARLASELLGGAAVALDTRTAQDLLDATNALNVKVKAKYEGIQYRLLMQTGREDLARQLPEAHNTPCLAGGDRPST